jgi:rubrerythrin
MRYNKQKTNFVGEGYIMALIQCPECNHEMSDTARICPNCGYKAKKSINKKQIIVICYVAIVIVGIMIFLS